ncbi:MAG: hypothetical protein ACM3X6_03915 [Patescibacteria group bacterium]
MVNLLGMAVAVITALYTFSYGIQVWRKEANPLGAAALGLLGAAVVLLPFYVLYLRR